MDKTHTDFLQECEAELALLKERVAALEEKLSAWKAEAQEADVPEADIPPEDLPPVDFTDVEMDGEAFGPEILSAPEEAPVEVPAADVPAADVPAEEEAPVTLEPDDTADLPWRKDRPGLQVKNIRSGISLYDRALFIGTLFKEDYTLYDNTIRELNELTTLDQAVDYIRRHFPDWNLHSDVVYSFMMAIRKKLG